MKSRNKKKVLSTSTTPNGHDGEVNNVDKKILNLLFFFGNLDIQVEVAKEKLLHQYYLQFY